MRRLLCSLFAVLLAVIVGRDAALAHWRAAGAGTAPRILAEDPALRLRLADSRLAEGASLQGEAPSIHQAAIALLRQSPLDASALRRLAVIENLRSAGEGHGLVVLAEKVSRRDLTSELLLIDTAAEHDDLAATLRHYDHVLSVYPAARQQLFPLLASEMGEPDVRKALVPMASRPWLRDFALNAVDYDVAPAALMDFYGELAGKIPVTELQAGAVRVVRWLQTNNQSAAIGTFANRIPGMVPHAFDQLGFTATTLDPRLAPLSWALTLGDAIDAESDGQTLTIRVAPENAGWAASRLTFLQAGQFEVTQTVAYAAGAPSAQLEWQVTCPDTKLVPLWQESLQPVAGRATTVSRFTVPSTCPVQSWGLKATAARSQFPSMARIVSLALKRL